MAVREGGALPNVNWDLAASAASYGSKADDERSGMVNWIEGSNREGGREVSRWELSELVDGSCCIYAM